MFHSVPTYCVFGIIFFQKCSLQFPPIFYGTQTRFFEPRRSRPPPPFLESPFFAFSAASNASHHMSFSLSLSSPLLLFHEYKCGENESRRKRLENKKIVLFVLSVICGKYISLLVPNSCILDSVMSIILKLYGEGII